MKNWLIKALGGVPGELHKEIVGDMKQEVKEHEEEANKWYSSYNRELENVHEYEKVLAKIEEDVPLDIRGGDIGDQLRMILQITDRPYYEFVVAASPVNICLSDGCTAPDVVSSKKKVIEMDMRMGAGQVFDDDMDISKVSHELAYNLAHECGMRVMEGLLANNGWRPKINKRKAA